MIDLMDPDILTIERLGYLPCDYEDERKLIGECGRCGHDIYECSGECHCCVCELYECPNFENYKFNGLLLCSDCVDSYDDVFTIDLGLVFLEKYHLEAEFFLTKIWDIKTYYIDNNRLIEPFKDEFLAAIEHDSCDKKRFIGELEDYCCNERFDYWIEFLATEKGLERIA